MAQTIYGNSWLLSKTEITEMQCYTSWEGRKTRESESSFIKKLQASEGNHIQPEENKQTRRDCPILPPKSWGYDIHNPSAPTELCFRFQWARGQTRRHRENQQQRQDAHCSEIYVTCLFYMIHVSYLCNNSLRSWMSESWGTHTSQNSAGKRISCRD